MIENTVIKQLKSLAWKVERLPSKHLPVKSTIETLEQSVIHAHSHQ